MLPSWEAQAVFCVYEDMSFHLSQDRNTYLNFGVHNEGVVKMCKYIIGCTLGCWLIDLMFGIKLKYVNHTC